MKLNKFLLSITLMGLLVSCNSINNYSDDNLSSDELLSINIPVEENYGIGFERQSLATYSPNENGEYSDEIPEECRDYKLEKQEDYEITYEKVNGTSSYTDICSMGVLDSLLYPGSIIDINNDAYAPINLDLAPLTISANLESTIGEGENVLYTTIENPSLSHVRQGIRDVINNNVTNPSDLPSSIQYEIKEISNEDEFDLNIGLGVKYNKFSISENFKYNKINKQTNLAVVFKQTFLKIDIDHRGIISLLAPSVTNKTLNEAFEGKIPAYVSSVSYGRIVIMTIQTNYSKEEITNVLNASWGQDGKATYNKGLYVGFESQIKNIALDKDTSIQYFEYGGGSGSGGVVNTLDSSYNQDSSNSLSNIFSKQFGVSEKNVGLPISYTLMDANGAPVKLQDSKEYYIKHIEYKPKKIMNWSWLDKMLNDGSLLENEELKIDLSAMIDYSKGEDGNDTVAERSIVIPSNINKVYLIGPTLSREYHFKNLSLTIGARSKEIDIHLDSIIFSANEKTGDGIALKAERESLVNLYIHNNVRISSVNGASAISIPNLNILGDGILEVAGSSLKDVNNAAIYCKKSLNVDLLGSLRVYAADGVKDKNINGGTAIESPSISLKTSEDSFIYGGNGASGYSSNKNGGNGGNAIVSTTISIESNNFKIVGGNGGNGYDGVNGQNENVGENGGNGGNGASSVISDSLKTEIAIYLNDGNGGDGGKGGNGGAGYGVVDITVDKKDGNRNYGRKGGNGGNGGHAGNSRIDIKEFPKELVFFTENKGGKGGDGGKGGKGGYYYNVWGSVYNCTGGSGGNGGNGGNGIIPGLGGKGGETGDRGSAKPVSGIGLGINYDSKFEDNGIKPVSGSDGASGSNELYC